MNDLVSEHMDSNHGPSACKADALNQLSYAPNFCRGNRSRTDGLQFVGLMILTY